MFPAFRRAIPAPLISLYHLCLAYFAAFLYDFPSRSITLIGVTGTKGKSSTTEFLNAAFETAGMKTALLNSIRIKLAERSEPNTMRMSMPGRLFIQKFLRDAIEAGCTVAILEMTSEGARQHRHRGLEMDALIFTNLAPEHIESHGSFQAYSDAKFSLGLQLARSKKRPRFMVANAEDPESGRYLTLPIEHALPFTLSGASPFHADEHGGYFSLEGEKITVKLPGEFSLKNALAAAITARAFGLPLAAVREGIASLARIPGRAEIIDAGQDFLVVVDYAHTPDSLKAIYDAYGTRRKICVLGSMGAGRDKWKRPLMGKIADDSCDAVILTNEDPGDEDPRSIVEALAQGMKRVPEIILDRRLAIRRACELARANDVVLITGKGTDPWIYGPRGTKIPWSDARVAREELVTLRGQTGTVV